MADPATLSALGLAGAAIGGVSAVAQGFSAKAAADFNADLAERDAAILREQGKFEREQIRRDARSVVARQRAAAAASGAGLEGTPLLIMAETAAEAELDILASRFSETVGVQNALANASLARFQGDQAVVGGIGKAGASLLTGASRAGDLFGEDE